MKFSKSWTVFALLAAIHFCLYPHVSLAQWTSVNINGTRVQTPDLPLFATKVYGATSGQVIAVGADGIIHGVSGLTGATGPQGAAGPTGAAGSNGLASLPQLAQLRAPQLKGVNISDPTAYTLNEAIGTNAIIYSGGNAPNYSLSPLLVCNSGGDMAMNATPFRDSGSGTDVYFFDQTGTYLNLGANLVSGHFTCPSTAAFFQTSFPPSVTVANVAIGIGDTPPTANAVTAYTGRRLCDMGDSYSAIYGYAWLPTLVAKAGFASYNADYSQGGLQTKNLFTLFSGSGSLQSQLTTYLANCDVLLIELGTNDANLWDTSARPLGALGDTNTSGTLYGDYFYVLQQTQMAKPGIPTFWMGPVQFSLLAFNSGTAHAGDLLAVSVIAGAIQDVTAHSGVMFIPLHATSGINQWTWATMLRDGIHPTDAVFTKVIAPLDAQYMLANSVTF